MVLITGSTSEIGLGLAQRYARTGAQLVLTGRSARRLELARQQVPRAATIEGDLANPASRERLADTVRAEYGRLDVLVNNAGIQRRIGIASDGATWPERQHEIDLLLAAPIHLVSLFTPLLLASEAGQLINVTSGGAFLPQAFAPTYSAAKAALHSYTMNARYAFGDTSVSVTELIPPAVATDLAGPGQTHGVDTDEYCDTAFPFLERRLDEVGSGPTATPEFNQRLQLEHDQFAAAATRFLVSRYAAIS